MDPLDFHAPFITTRRSTGSRPSLPCTAASDEASPRVPFSWERAAGVPKDTLRRRRSHREPAAIHMPPKPPPGRPPPQPRNGERCSLHPPADDDDGNDGDIDCGDGSDGEDDVFSDALDRISLSEAAGVECNAPGVSRTPSFIMNRFLPAANACARQANPSKRPHARPRPAINDAKLPLGYVPPIRTRRPTSPTGCGLVLLSPWSLNHSLCGLKRAATQCRTPAPARRPAFSSGDGGTDPKAFRGPGWGMPFLDTSRLRTIRRKARDDPTADERATWRLPPLKPPSESWLSHAVNSLNRTK